MIKIDSDEYITKAELAAMFSLEETTIRDWVSKRQIPSIKLGKVRIFHLQTINEWLKDQIEQ